MMSFLNKYRSKNTHLFNSEGVEITVVITIDHYQFKDTIMIHVVANIV